MSSFVLKFSFIHRIILLKGENNLFFHFSIERNSSVFYFSGWGVQIIYSNFIFPLYFLLKNVEKFPYTVGIREFKESCLYFRLMPLDLRSSITSLATAMTSSRVRVRSMQEKIRRRVMAFPSSP